MVLTDATTVTVSGKQNYVRNFSIGKMVIYHAMKSKAIDALKKIEKIKKNYHNLIEKNFHETSIGLSDMLK